MSDEDLPDLAIEEMELQIRKDYEEKAAREAASRWRQDYHVDEDTWTFKEGLPTEVSVPLALVNRAFLHEARKMLYGNDTLNFTDLHNFSLFVRTLTSPQVSAFFKEEDVTMTGSSADGILGKPVDHSIGALVNGLRVHYGQFLLKDQALFSHAIQPAAGRQA